MEQIAQVLRDLPKPSHPDLLVGTDHFDDAGVYRISDDVALVQTLDFFPPLVDDPYTFGLIAAANSLSDVYAMGGEPLTALNIVGFPDQELPLETLGAILRGGSDKVTEAGAVVVGGHSVRDAEVKYGLSVTGRVHPSRIMTNGGAQPGDVLILTKPIGSGIMTSAAKAGKIDEAGLQEAVDVMTQLNAVGRDAMAEHGANAGTDITGFGLIGHAFEIAEASGVTLRMRASAVPLLEGTLHWAQRKCLTRACASTLAFVGDGLVVRGVDAMLVQVLADAQTSGGLLLSVRPAVADALLATLTKKGAACAACVGEVAERTTHAIELAP